jgi:hypothetical protein
MIIDYLLGHSLVASAVVNEGVPLPHVLDFPAPAVTGEG